MVPCPFWLASAQGGVLVLPIALHL